METSIIHSREPVKMNGAWFSYFQDELKSFQPVCRYCGKTCQWGSYADHFYPYYDKTSYHVICHRKHQNRTENKEEF